MLPPRKKKPKPKHKILVKFLAVVINISFAIIAFTSFGFPTSASPPSPVHIEDNPNTRVDIGEVSYKRAIQTGKLFGHENYQHFSYKESQTPSAVESSETDGWLTQSMKSVGRTLLQKENNLDLKSFFMLGYDLSKLKSSDVTYDLENQTLNINTPPLELVYIPLFSPQSFNSAVGVLREDYTDIERNTFYINATNEGIKQVMANEDEIQKGRDLTDEAIKKLLLDIYKETGVSKKVKQIKFKHSKDIKLVIQKN